MFVQRKPFINDKTNELPDIMIPSLSPPVSTELVGLSAHIRRIEKDHFIILSLYLQQKFVARCLCMLHFWLQSESCIAPSLPSAWQLNWNVCVGSAYHAMAVPGLSQWVIACVGEGWQLSSHGQLQTVLGIVRWYHLWMQNETLHTSSWKTIQPCGHFCAFCASK